MRPRKPRAPRRPRAPRSTGAWRATAAGVGGGDLLQAAEEIADGAREIAARELAGRYTTGATVASIRTEQQDENTVMIVADSGAAYPNEVAGVRHPTFGHSPWKTNQYRPFLAPAAEDRAGVAMDKFALVIDRHAKELGFE